jgi:hypothetical protein
MSGKVGCLSRRHVMDGAETRKPYCYRKSTQGIGRRYVVLDAFIKPPS